VVMGVGIGAVCLLCCRFAAAWFLRRGWDVGVRDDVASYRCSLELIRRLECFISFNNLHIFFYLRTPGWAACSCLPFLLVRGHRQLNRLIDCNVQCLVPTMGWASRIIMCDEEVNMSFEEVNMSVEDGLGDKDAVGDKDGTGDDVNWEDGNLFDNENEDDDNDQELLI